MECGKKNHRACNFILERGIRIKMQIICQSGKCLVFLHNFHGTRQ